MKRPNLRATILTALALLLAGAASAVANSRDDEVAIEALEARQVAAWNAHDIAAYAALFTDDADVVNVLGWRWHGRRELASKLAAAHASVFRDSVLTVQKVSIRPLSPSLAVAQVTWRMTGARAPDGVQSHLPEQGVQTQVLQRTRGVWLICAFQNTNSVPETTFAAR